MALSEASQALLKAAKSGDLAFVQARIAEGADVNTKDTFDENLFFLACRSGNVELVQFLLDQSADFSQLNTGKHSALLSACVGGNLEVVKKLVALEREAGKITWAITAKRGSSPLSIAFQYKHVDIIEYFLVENLISDEDLMGIPSSSSDAQDTVIKLIDRILKIKPVLVSHITDRFFAQMIMSSNIQGIKYMLKTFPELKTRMSDFLYPISGGFTVSTSKTLRLESKQDKSELFNNYIKQIYIHPAKNKSLSFFLEQQYLSMEAVDKADGQTLLHFVAMDTSDEYEDVIYIPALLSMGFPIDVRNSKQQTPLHVAIEGGLFFHALCLIYFGADVNAEDQDGRKPRDYAARFISLGEETIDEELSGHLISILKEFEG